MADINKQPKIRENYDPNQEEKDTIQFVYQRKREMEDSPMRQKAMEMADKGLQAWEALREAKKEDDWQSNHYVPLTQSMVETALSEMIDQNTRPFYLPRGQEDVPKATVYSHIDEYAWEVGDADLQMYDILKGALIKGTSVAQEYYWQERRVVQESSIQNKKEVLTETNVIDFDDVYMEDVRLEDFYVDEFSRGFSGPYAARDCIRRYIMNIEDFKVMFSGKQWNPLGNAQYVKAGGDTDFYEYYKPPQGINHSKQVEVLWYWAEKPKDWLIIVANDVLIKKSPNPYKHKKLPFARALAVKRLNSFYGKGLAEILESTQDEMNTIRRMTIDRAHLDIDKMFFVSSRLTLNEEDLIARPHGMIPVDDVNGSKPVEYGDVPRSVEIALSHLEDDAIISTGINPRAQSLPQAGTATEAAILKESTLKRLKLILWLLRKEFLIPHARLRMSNILQYYSQPRLEKIVGDESTQEFKNEVAKLEAQGLLLQTGGDYYKKSYRTVRLQDKQFTTDVKGLPQIQPATGFTFFEADPKYFVPVSKEGFDIRFMAGTEIEISKPLMQTKMLELYDRVSQVALAVPNSYDIVKLTDKVIETYPNINPNELKPDEAVQSDQEQRLQMQIDLAGMENKMMMQGKDVPPTPYASPAHTRVHTTFMKSPEFQQNASSQVVQIFTNHVVGELGLQNLRNNPQGQPGQPPAPGQQPAAPGGQPQAAQPPQTMIIGKDTGQTMRTSVSQGIQNRPGGMQKPGITLNEILPSLKTGGNKA